LGIDAILLDHVYVVEHLRVVGTLRNVFDFLFDRGGGGRSGLD